MEQYLQLYSRCSTSVSFRLSAPPLSLFSLHAHSLFVLVFSSSMALSSRTSPLLIFLLGFFSLLLHFPLSLSTAASTPACTSQSFSKNRLYQLCNDLPTLASSLHWTFDPLKSSLSLAFVAPPAKPGGWIAWAINPTDTGMIGSQSLIAFHRPDRSMTVATFNVSSYFAVSPSKIAYDVPEMEAEFSNGVMRIFATITLPAGTAEVNQVWQVGSSVTNSVPDKHGIVAANLNAKGRLDLMKGQTTSAGTGDSKIKKRNIHGVLNAVSWGILMPIGVIIARHVRTFRSADPAWFYLHVSCQFSGYVVGVAGWATGLQLGKQSKGIEYKMHRNIGIALFCLATLQVLALLLRPKKDHKWRIYWNFYHHSVGYTVIVLSIINVFKGLDILDPEKKWKTAYIIVLATLGAIAVVMEVVTWVVVLRRKKIDNNTKLYEGSNGANGQRV